MARSSIKKMLIEEIAPIIKKSGYIAALTGAGISTSAGIPDFRGKHGIYTTKKYPPEVFDIARFDDDPSIFYNYAKDFIEFEEKLKPTFTHIWLAELEKSGKLKFVITQNVDGLHQKAGTKNIIEIHGGFGKSFCRGCRAEYGFKELKKKIHAESVPKCGKCGGIIKPDIVFFGEPIKSIIEAEGIVEKADLLLVIGTSLTVYPAAMLPSLAKGRVIVVNKGNIGANLPQAAIFDSDIDGFFKTLEPC